MYSSPLFILLPPTTVFFRHTIRSPTSGRSDEKPLAARIKRLYFFLVRLVPQMITSQSFQLSFSHRKFKSRFGRNDTSSPATEALSLPVVLISPANVLIEDPSSVLKILSRKNIGIASKSRLNSSVSSLSDSMTSNTLYPSMHSS